MDLWQSLVLATVVSTLTLLASLFGMHSQVKEQRRVRDHDLTRESQLRLHADRVATYTAFYREGGNMRHALGLRTGVPDDQDLKASAIEQRAALWRACTSVTLVGSREAALAAWDLLDYATNVVKYKTELDLRQYTKLIWGFVDTARRDLQFPDAPDTPAVGLWERRHAAKALAETEALSSY
ncbi:hypothetical protein KGQ20_15965 [Catenulispora sp. NF23]|uniref:hypothetical protein n=1 Tax=Catenulispora pinistramenti TaxID=2705254 RepID=UPI001BA9DE41|nr:hypothetical protein [Catenulispora pinistramenti]MBS2534267.1 hypothetical protein [Catenulispora pinistramenti]